jgi:hypothetical protein
VAGFIAALVKRVITEVVGTSVAPSPGRIAVTEGCVLGNAVVNVNWLVVFAKALLDRSRIPLESATVIVAPGANAVPLGFMTIVRLSREML